MSKNLDRWYNCQYPRFSSNWRAVQRVQLERLDKLVIPWNVFEVKSCKSVEKILYYRAKKSPKNGKKSEVRKKLSLPFSIFAPPPQSCHPFWVSLCTPGYKDTFASMNKFRSGNSEIETREAVLGMFFYSFNTHFHFVCQQNSILTIKAFKISRILLFGRCNKLNFNARIIEGEKN